MRVLFISGAKCHPSHGGSIEESWANFQLVSKAKEEFFNTTLWQGVSDLGHDSNVIYRPIDAPLPDKFRLDILKYSPDAIIAFQPDYLNASTIEFLRNSLPSVKILCYLCIDIIESFADISKYDAVLACTPGYVNAANDKGYRAFLLYHTWEPSMAIKNRLQQESSSITAPISFVGSIVLNNLYHLRRGRLVERLADTIKSSFLLHADICVPRFGPKFWIKRPKEAIVINRLAKRLQRVNKGCLRGYDYLNAIRNSFLTFNEPVDCSGNDIGNIRLFEASALGTAQLVPQVANLDDLFEADTEILTYSSEEMLVNRVHDLLRKPEYLVAVGQKSQERWSRSHTVKRRMEQLLYILEHKV